MSIQANSALYSLLGVVWGGDARNTFGIPNLSGRSPYGLGQARNSNGAVVGSLDWQIGYLYGTDQYTLSQLNLPAHVHDAEFTPTYTGGNETATPAYVKVSSAKATTDEPNGNILAKSWDSRTSSIDYTYIQPESAGTLGNLAGVGGGTGGMTGGTVEIAPSGSNAPFMVATPGAGVNFCIVTSGVYPSFN